MNARSTTSQPVTGPGAGTATLPPGAGTDSIHQSRTPYMMVDPDLIIRYMNPAANELFAKWEPELQQILPHFRKETLIGQCIDVFHKVPSHQRRMLLSPENLPMSKEIRVGPLSILNNVVALRGPDHQLIGLGVEWIDMTEQRAKEREVATFMAAIGAASVPLMLVDVAGRITYLNLAADRLMQATATAVHNTQARFDARQLVGSAVRQLHERPDEFDQVLAACAAAPAVLEGALGGRSFKVCATAIVDAAGQRQGSTIEWQDVTAQNAAEQRVDQLIRAASQGILSERLDTTEFPGFAKQVAGGLNALLDAMSGPISETMRVVSAMADGDLSVETEGNFAGAFGALTTSLNRSITNLRDMLRRVQVASSTITQGAAELNEGNMNLSSRTQEQAAALEETSATVTEIAATIKKSAETAKGVAELAAGARTVAEKGGEVVGRTIGAMQEIKRSSAKIADIIGVIDEIAFQTNLLALNAAVEAARAGEQGRGFAVVASEVRNLAQRSATAAKEIKTLIRDSVEKVDLGTRLVDASGAHLKEIVANNQKVSDLVAGIASASEEQATGIEQVERAVSQMDEMTQQNAALVEEAAAASASVDEQAHRLDDIVSEFAIDEGFDDDFDDDDLDNDRPAPVRQPAPPARRAPVPPMRPSPKTASPSPHRPLAARPMAKPAAKAAPARPSAALRPVSPTGPRLEKVPASATGVRKSMDPDDRWESF
jgi:methyl-accepting chemotaxis protein